MLRSVCYDLEPAKTIFGHVFFVYFRLIVVQIIYR